MYQIMVLKLNFGLPFETLSRVKEEACKGGPFGVFYTPPSASRTATPASSHATVEYTVFSSLEALTLHGSGPYLL